MFPAGIDNGPSGLSIVQVPPGRESLRDTPVIVLWFGLFTLMAPATTNSVSVPPLGVTTTSYSNVAGVPSGTVCDESPVTDFSIDQS